MELAEVEKLAHWVSKHDTDRVVLVVTEGNDALLETAFEQVFHANSAPNGWKKAIRSVTRCWTRFGQPAVCRPLGRARHPIRRNVVVGVAGRSSRSMWAALQTELQMTTARFCGLHTSSGGYAVCGRGFDGALAVDVALSPPSMGGFHPL